MKYENFCLKLIELIGGKDNISAVTHCSTRLRFTLKDEKKADTKEIKKLKEVIDVAVNPIAYMVIIGPDVANVHADLVDLLGGNKEASEKPEPRSIINRILNLLSETMNPILLPIMAAGMIAGILAILDLMGLVSPDNSTYVIFDTIRSAIFFFLPVYIAMSSAKRLNVNQYMAVTLAVVLLSSSINGIGGLTLFNIPLQTISYSNSFIPILLGIWFMGLCNKYLDRVIPKSLKHFFLPIISLAITLVITLFLFGPIGSWMSEGLKTLCEWLMNTFGNWTVIALYAAFQPLLVMFGANTFSTPIMMNFMNTLGYDPVLLIAATLSNIATAGAVFGYFFKSKNIGEKQMFGTAGLSAVMGITEPAVYGVFIKYRRPFIAVMIAGAVSGIVAGLFNVKGYVLVASVPGLSTYAVGGDSNLYGMLIASALAFVIALAVAYFLGIPKDTESIVSDNKTKPMGAMSEQVITPIEGKLVKLADVNDEAFSSGALGKGIAIYPDVKNNLVKSPIEGEVVAVYPTNHAIGLRTKTNIELLIHVGINTVELNGKYFKTIVKQGDIVKKGDILLEVDFENIKNEKMDPTIMVVVTNTSDFLEIVPSADEIIKENETLLTVIM